MIIFNNIRIKKKYKRVSNETRETMTNRKSKRTPTKKKKKENTQDKIYMISHRQYLLVLI